MAIFVPLHIPYSKTEGKECNNHYHGSSSCKEAESRTSVLNIGYAEKTLDYGNSLAAVHSAPHQQFHKIICQKDSTNNNIS